MTGRDCRGDGAGEGAEVLRREDRGARPGQEGLVDWKKLPQNAPKLAPFSPRDDLEVTGGA